jgi:signal transduction histidine kinase
MKMTIYRKMIIGFGLIIFMIIGANAYTLLELNSATSATRATLSSDIQSMDLAKEMRSLLYEADRNAQKYLINGDATYYDLFLRTASRFRENLERLAALEPDEAEARLIRQLRQTEPSLALPVKGPAKRWERTATRTAVTATIARLGSTVDQLIRTKERSLEASITALRVATRRSSGFALAIGILTLLAASVVAWLITRTITRPISRVIQATQQIAKGSFEPIRTSSNDETALLAGAVNDMADRLKKMNEFKANLMHHIVHELRTPLQVITAAQSILTDQQLGNVNNRQLDMLDLIRRNAGSLTNFTNQFLDLAKIEGDMMKFEFKPTDLVSVITGAIRDAQPLAFSKGISIELSAAEKPSVQADEKKLSQVFINLLSNAIKYSHPGGAVLVSVDCSPKRARVTVQDTGIGIAPEDLPKLFGKFYQGANAAGPGRGGTGLGLALVKALVEGHGGNVFVASAPGAGSAFTVDLPLAAPASDDARPLPEAGAQAAAAL